MAQELKRDKKNASKKIFLDALYINITLEYYSRILLFYKLIRTSRITNCYFCNINTFT